jgi:hypothetical protein
MVKFHNMRRIFREKRFILFLSIIALVTLPLLAAGLRNLHFDEGHPLGILQSIPTQNYAPDLVNQFVSVPLWKQLAFWILVISLVVLAASLLSPELRKRFIRTILSLALTLFALSYLLDHNLINLPEFQSASSSAAEAGLQNGGDLPPPPVFSPPEIPGWMNFLISLGVVLAFLGGGWILLRWWQRLNRPYQSTDTLKDLASIARSSLRDLSSGGDWADAVTNCYVRMSEVVSRTRGLYRQEAMTPAEFAFRLEHAGLPSDPVQRLTHLFESVRYGMRKPAKDEINEAVLCLNAILHYCGEDA